VAANATALIPDGFKFPKASFAVRVVVMDDPAITEAAEVVTSDLASENPAGEIFIKLEQSVVKDPELARR
jgi:hypothetical protein